MPHNSKLPYKESNYSSDAIRPPIDDDDEVYPCIDCGKLRSKNQGGTTFAVCDECWDKKKEKVNG